ncbi:uncharacterized protein [Ptychodera flava]|uniref:uncharacterized protein n=1 Tax=Ptychodera flava TaxID=63121 RepID=UPI00396A211E
MRVYLSANFTKHLHLSEAEFKFTTSTLYFMTITKQLQIRTPLARILPGHLICQCVNNIRKMADSSAGSQKSSETDAIYHEVSKTKLLAVKIYGAVTVLMVILAMIFCIAKGSQNTHYFLLLVNLIISSLVGLAVTWWYKRGDLAVDKLWFLVLVASVIVFQCITTDIYVWGHSPQSSIQPSPSPPSTPRFTTPNITNITTPKQDVELQQLPTSLPDPKEQLQPPDDAKASHLSRVSTPTG